LSRLGQKIELFFNIKNVCAITHLSIVIILDYYIRIQIVTRIRNVLRKHWWPMNIPICLAALLGHRSVIIGVFGIFFEIIIDNLLMQYTNVSYQICITYENQEKYRNFRLRLNAICARIS